jgi:hypothetical protein
MICFPNPVLTEDLCILRKEEFSVTCCMCDANHIHKRQTHLLVREDVTQDYDHKVSVAKEISGR